MAAVIAVHPRFNLLRYLVDVLAEKANFENTLVLFPNKRPILFASRYIHEKLKKPCLLPKMQAFQDWCVETYAKSRKNPETVISDYDHAWIAFEAASEVLKNKKIARSWDSFMDWAFRLCDLFNKFDEELCNPQDVEHPYPNAGEKTAVLLENLGKIYDRRNQILGEKKLITPSAILRRLAEEEFLLPEEDIYIVGFYALTNAESKIFRRMYEKGATILWHTDLNKLDPLYERWKKQWNLSEIENVGPDASNEIKFYQCHGFHPELDMLKKALGTAPERFDQKAIVLCSQNALIPLLYSLPDWEVNITMGYPLKLTPLYSFITGIEEVINSKNKSNQKYSSKSVADLLTQPLIPQWRDLYKRVLSKGAFVDPIADDELKKIFEMFIFPFESAKTPRDMAEALVKVLSFINRYTDDSSPIEKGFIVKTAEVATEALKNSLFAEQKMSTKSLFVLLKKTLERVSVPFEGEPLRGLQVMGMLETRLLSFDEVFILDANEDVLPGAEEVNPLVFWDPNIDKLPDRFREEAISKYHFSRLVASSRKVHIFWQHQVTAGKGSMEGKKEKSRYVEQLMWEKEKENKAKLEDSLIEKSKLAISPEVIVTDKYLEKTTEHKKELKKLLKETKVSASLLDLYITCPLRFYYERVLKLEAPGVPNEVESRVVGNAMHEALEEYYKSFGLPAEIKREQLDADRLFELFVEHFEKAGKISPEKEFLLYETVKYRLKAFVEGQPEETEVLHTEKALEHTIEVDGVGEVHLFGKIDRIDRREARHLFNKGDETLLVIVDYKTGYKKGEWKKDILKFSETASEEADCEETLNKLREKLKSIQLPMYAYLSFKGGICSEEENVAAVYVDLYKSGKEIPFVKPHGRMKNPLKPVHDFNRWVIDGGFESLLASIIRHILECPYWYPSDGSACSYCPYKQFCKYG